MGVPLTIVDPVVDATTDGRFEGKSNWSLLSWCERFVDSLPQPHKVPPTPQLRTIPLPLVAEWELPDGDHHDQAPQQTDTSNQEAEGFAGLAIAKPKDTENETQPGIIYGFYPARNHALY